MLSQTISYKITEKLGEDKTADQRTADEKTPPGSDDFDSQVVDEAWVPGWLPLAGCLRHIVLCDLHGNVRKCFAVLDHPLVWHARRRRRDVARD